jgi:hypothetical protein
MDEYREIGINWRYWGEQRFKQLTAYLTVTGALGAAALSEYIGVAKGAPSRPWVYRFVIAALGLLATAVFALIDERATYYRRAFMERAKALEAWWKLRAAQNGEYFAWMYHATNISRWEHRTAALAFRFFFGAIFVMWASYSAESDKLQHVHSELVVPAAVGIVLLAAWQAHCLQESLKSDKNKLKTRLGVPQPPTSAGVATPATAASPTTPASESVATPGKASEAIGDLNQHEAKQDDDQPDTGER